MVQDNLSSAWPLASFASGFQDGLGQSFYISLSTILITSHQYKHLQSVQIHLNVFRLKCCKHFSYSYKSRIFLLLDSTILTSLSEEYKLGNSLLYNSSILLLLHVLLTICLQTQLIYSTRERTCCDMATESQTVQTNCQFALFI